ncbi:hypothetical protein M434DRAFT_34021 [Hypoxylon sp. CO27-5]|nr:hypothetical protein M434DRAFT_34021 [Hypoxylon sp. CO27-5]
MAGGVQHHCPKRFDGGKNCRLGREEGKTLCTEHEILCKKHRIPTLKNKPCYSCIREFQEKEKKKKEENEKAKAERQVTRDTRSDKKKYKKN